MTGRNRRRKALIAWQVLLMASVRFESHLLKCQHRGARELTSATATPHWKSCSPLCKILPKIGEQCDSNALNSQASGLLTSVLAS